jgi:hypothetical protein
MVMEKKAEWEIPLKITLNFDDVEDLEALKGSEEFLDLIYKAVVAALKQAIRKNKSECVLFEVVNHNAKIKVKKDQYKDLLGKCVIYYEQLEDYTTCQELVELKQRF